MKTLCAVVLLLLLALSLLTGCHNTGRQIRKALDGTHDLLLEGSY
ncbi:MAG: hypothetical protein NTX71_00630 [Candidatus Aureabacteria bacterium]|nr:hypothetical protein [Candidatus Auribacterota bacterium]